MISYPELGDTAENKKTLIVRTGKIGGDELPTHSLTLLFEAWSF